MPSGHLPQSFLDGPMLRVSMDLPPAEEITRQVDVDTLETTSWTMGVRYVKKVTKAEASPASRAQDIVKKKKKKKKGW